MRTVNTFTKSISLFFFLFLFVYIPASAYSLKQYNAKDGLSGSSILSIYQDHRGFVWLSTTSGMNIFDGLQFKGFRPVGNPDFLSGYVISDLFETDEHIFWFITDQGLIRYDDTRQEPTYFKDITLDSHIAKGPDNTLYTVKEDGFIYFYTESSKSFEKTATGNIRTENIIKLFVDYQNTLWVISDDNNHKHYSISREGTGIKLTALNQFRHKHQILWCYQGEKELFFVDESLTFFEYNLENGIKQYIHDLTETVIDYGPITSIIKDKGDYFLGSSDGGLFRIKYAPDKMNKYHLLRTNIHSGVLCVTKDKKQDIVWAGTETEGVYMYFNEKTSTENYLSDNLKHTVANPVTALFLDKTQTLRIGTAGNGIISIYDFEADNPGGSQSEAYTPNNTPLPNATINTFTPSVRNIFWIGTENGVSYYSYIDRKIKNLSLAADGRQVRQVRSICEVNDSTLYVTSRTSGIVRVELSERNDVLNVKAARQIKVGDASLKAEWFTTAYKENKSTIWIGTTGEGVFKLDCETEKAENILLQDKDSIPETIHTITKTAAGLWFGTSKGLVLLNGNEKSIFNEKNDYPYKDVYAIQEDNNGNLWLSTNCGMGQFNTEKSVYFPFAQKEGREITRYSPNSGCRDINNDVVLLGGDTGYTIIRNNDIEQQNYSPEIMFNELFIAGKEKNIFDFLTNGRSGKRLAVGCNQNVLSIPFIAIDYIDGKNYEYYYKLDELGDYWINNSNSNIAFFTYLPNGVYTLSAKYYNKANGKESREYSMILHVLPPWYKTWWAYLIYIAVVAIILYTGYLITVHRTKKKMGIAKENKPGATGDKPLANENKS